MNTSDKFAKTPAGSEEIRARALKLPQRLRTVLIMADGTLTGAQLQDAAVKLSAPEGAVETLLTMGLIAAQPGRAAAPAASTAPAAQSARPAPAALPTAADGEQFRVAQKFMNDSAVDLLGLRAFFFTLKLEKCYTRADLLALVPDFTKAITKGGGEQVASVLETRAKELLS